MKPTEFITTRRNELSLLTESIISECDGALHDSAVARLAQVLCNAESKNHSVAEQAHEDLEALMFETPDREYDMLLEEATKHMVSERLKPWMYMP